MSAQKKCLLVEESRVVAKLIADSVSAQGYDVLGAEKLDGALKAFRNETFDVLILDLMAIGGATGLRKTREHFARGGIIAMTGAEPNATSSESLDHVQSAGANVLLRKPFNPAQLKDAVGEAYWAGFEGGRGHVLVVDDSRVVLSIAKRALQTSGYKVSTRSSMEEALEGVAALNVDCVVTDIFMPGMGGIEGVMMLRKLHPQLAVVAMSGGLDGQMEANASLTAASKIGAGATLQKPFSDQKLVDAVKTAIAARARTAA